jgi:hypothetical protein
VFGFARDENWRAVPRTGSELTAAFRDFGDSSNVFRALEERSSSLTRIDGTLGYAPQGDD